MKRIPLLILIFLAFQKLEAQENLVDSLYTVRPVETLVYAEKDGEELIIDLFLPETDSKKDFPLLVFMHGGGFAGGSPKNPQEVEFAQIAASKGYAVGLISYRLPRRGKPTGFGCDFDAEGKIETFRMAAQDLMDAVSFLERHSKDHYIDTQNIILGGSSAGAEAVLNAVYNPELMFGDSGKYADLNISAVFSLAGAVVDSRYITKENAVPGIFFHGTDDNLVPYATAPHHYCDEKKSGYLILDGSKTIVERLEQLDASYLFYTFRGARHEISGMPFEHLPEVFGFLKASIFQKQKIQTKIYQ